MLTASRVLPFSSTPSNSSLSRAPEPSASDLRAGAECLLGPSSAMARLWSQVRLIAPHFRIALLTGESSTGEDAIARALHDLSSFAGCPLLTLRAEDADRQLRSFKALLAGGEGGALYLPNVDRLSTASQSLLLRLVRLRRHRRISVIAFAGRDLHPLVAAGAFNAELATHLGSLRIALPPLRDRRDDIPLLFTNLIQTEAQRRALVSPALSSGFLARAAAFDWPGNLTQLRSIVQWLFENRAERTALECDDLDDALASVKAPPAQPSPVRMVPLDQVVHEHIRAVLLGCNGNKLRAAEVLGISRSTLYRMLDASNPAVDAFALAG